MALNQFKSWKLLYEDHDLCFSKAVNKNDASKVFFITFFNPDKMSVATKHLLKEHLHNYINLIEEDGKLHLILRANEGRPIHTFIKHSNLEYDDRVQIVFEYFKRIEKYDAFPDAIKLQLLDDEQLLISDEGLSFRELIDYAPTQIVSPKDVFKQLGKTLDLILMDAEGYHSQFIDNLILGIHNYDSLNAVKNHFKDVFIFEKPDALESINYEYTIILNDLDAGPPIRVTKDLPSQKKQEPNLPPSVYDPLDIQHDDLRRELADLLLNNRAISKAEPVQEETPKIVEEPEVPVHEENFEDVEIAAQAAVPVVDASDLFQSISTTVPTASKDTKSFRAIFQEDDEMPDALPKSSKQRFLEEDDALFVDDVSEMFDASSKPEKRFKNGFQIKWLLIAVAVLLFLILSLWGIKSLFNSKPIAAHFEIEPLHDNRIAFMNTSTGGKKITAYSWEIYYADSLVQEFEDENLFPVFDTEGDYTIVMKVQDKSGNWSEPFTQAYTFEMNDAITQPIDTTETP